MWMVCYQLYETKRSKLAQVGQKEVSGKLIMIRCSWINECKIDQSRGQEKWHPGNIICDIHGADQTSSTSPRKVT